MTVARTTADIAAADTYSDPVRIRGRYNFVLSGTFVATVNVERSFIDPEGSPAWHNIADASGVEDFTGPVALVGDEPEGAWYRFGVAAGNYTSGTVVGRISQ